MRENRQHVSEIEAVLAGGQTNRDSVVTDSWIRCVGEHQLDPAITSEAYIVPHTQLREHRERSERLINIARGGLETLFRQIAGQNYVLLLADSQGVTVDYFGDNNFKDHLQKAGLYLGSDWSEERSGTCGVGSCIATGEALTIHQTDHFDLTHTPLSCTAAPIYDTQGALTAVLDISLLRSPQPKVSQQLALHLVSSSARRIENACLTNDMRSEWVLCFSRSPATLDVDPESTIALDGSGRVIGMTHSGAQLLSEISGTSWRSPANLLGKNLSQYFASSINELPLYTRDRPVSQRRIIGRDGSCWYAHAIDPARHHKSTPRPIKTPKPVERTNTCELGTLSGGDPVLGQHLKQAARVARTSLPVLISGETGSGKEFFARAIHNAGMASNPFIAVNCAAIPENLIEAELFGYKGGAFTGATRNGHKGLIEAADGGTLFLDEIGDMPLELQARLLRFLSEGEIRRVGDTKARVVNVRIIAASLHDLPQQVDKGLFRSDLYFRLNCAEFHMPALRERRDLDYLIDMFLNKHQKGVELTPAIRALLHRYHWPGNLRELDNTLQFALAMTDSSLLDAHHLPVRFHQPIVTPSAVALTTLASQRSDNNAVSDRELLLAVERNSGNKSAAARELCIDRSTIYRRLARLTKT